MNDCHELVEGCKREIEFVQPNLLVRKHVVSFNERPRSKVGAQDHPFTAAVSFKAFAQEEPLLPEAARWAPMLGTAVWSKSPNFTR